MSNFRAIKKTTAGNWQVFPMIRAFPVSHIPELSKGEFILYKKRKYRTAKGLIRACRRDGIIIHE